MASKIVTNSSDKQPKTYKPKVVDGKRKQLKGGMKGTDSVIDKVHTSGLSATTNGPVNRNDRSIRVLKSSVPLLPSSNHGNNQKKGSNPFPNAPLPSPPNRSKQKKGSNPVLKSQVLKSPTSSQRSRSPKRNKSTEKRKSDRTRLSIQSHIARMSGGTRDGIVDKAKLKDDKTKHDIAHKSQLNRRNTKPDQLGVFREQSKSKRGQKESLDDKIKTKGNKTKEHLVAKKVPKRNSKDRDYKRTAKQQKEDDRRKRMESKIDFPKRDGTTPKPDSSRSMTESEYCYSSDPDWDKSICSESSSDDTQPDLNIAMVQFAQPGGDSEDDMHKSNASSSLSESSLDRSLNTEDSFNEVDKASSVDNTLETAADRADLQMTSPFRSTRDQSPAESISSYSSDMDLISQGECGGTKMDGHINSLITKKQKSYRQKTITKQNKQGPVKGKVKDAKKAMKCTTKSQIDLDRRRFEVPTRKQGTNTRRIQSESVVRGYRSRKRRSPPSQKITVGSRKRMEDEKEFVFDKGKRGEISTNEERERRIRSKEMGSIDKDKEKGIADGKRKYRSFSTDIGNATGSGKEKEKDNKAKGKVKRFNDDNKVKYETKAESKSSVRFKLPDKSNSRESIISNDEAIISDGYSGSSSTSSITSEVVSDNRIDDSDMDCHVVPTRTPKVTRELYADRRSVGRERKYGKDNNSTMKKKGERERRFHVHVHESQSKKIIDQQTTSDISPRQKSVKSRHGKTKEAHKTSSIKLVKCQSANQTKAADRIPHKLRMYTVPVSSHPKSESELLKYVELQSKASVCKVKSPRPGFSRETLRKETISGQSLDKKRKCGDGKPQMKTTMTVADRKCGSEMKIQNQRVYSNGFTEDSMTKAVVSNGHGMKGDEQRSSAALRRGERGYYKQKHVLKNRTRIEKVN